MTMEELFTILGAIIHDHPVLGDKKVEFNMDTTHPEVEIELLTIWYVSKTETIIISGFPLLGHFKNEVEILWTRNNELIQTATRAFVAAGVLSADLL